MGPKKRSLRSKFKAFNVHIKLLQWSHINNFTTHLKSQKKKKEKEKLPKKTKWEETINVGLENPMT